MTSPSSSSSVTGFLWATETRKPEMVPVAAGCGGGNFKAEDRERPSEVRDDPCSDGEDPDNVVVLGCSGSESLLPNFIVTFALFLGHDGRFG
mmetsp:Transcript_9354/g.18433  ORF Transcript_9354/g.18433 Transcript_9354/m.18433 type:complete len:92 (+) Transcript_9354:436-711(+)